MTVSEHWEQFSAYRPMIEDARNQERILIASKVNDIINSVVDYGLGSNYPRIKNAVLNVIFDGDTPKHLIEPAWTEGSK